MNTSSPGDSTSANTSSARRRWISIPFLIVALVLGVGAYYAGPKIMAYYFLWSDRGSSAAIPAENVSPERPSFPSDGNPRGFGGGGEVLSQDPAERAKRRPPAEFDEETKPTGEAATPAVPKT